MDKNLNVTQINEAPNSRYVAQLNLTERIIEEQKKLNIKNIKVMTNEQSLAFVASYNEAAKLSDGDKLNGIMLSLAENYGDNDKR